MWMALRERVCAIDEINMATMRMRLRLPNELPADPPEANVVEPAEVIHPSFVLKLCQITANILIKSFYYRFIFLKSIFYVKYIL